MKWRFGLLLAMGCIGLQVAAWAGPNQITYQGTLKQTGVPMNGLVNMQFSFVDVNNNQIPGTSIFNAPNVQVTNGLFSIQIPIPNGVDWSQYSPYLQISVGGQALNPPQAISANLYSIANQIPSGSITAYAGAIIPTGWLLCDGSAVSRTKYSSLFAALGTVWGAGDGTTFNLPDLRGRAPIGAGQGPALTNRTLAQTIGEENHILSIAEMPPHTHGVIDPGHQHEAAVGGAGVFGGGPTRYPVEGGTGAYSVNTTLTSVSQTNISLASAGGGTPHNIMQPSAVVNFIIKD